MQFKTESFQIHAAILFLFIPSEWEAVWANLANLNVGESICLFYLSISVACTLTHLTNFSGKETSRVADKTFIKVYFHSMVHRGLKRRL